MPIDEFSVYLDALAAAATHQRTLEAQKRSAEIEHAEKLAAIKAKERTEEKKLLVERQKTAEKECAANSVAQAVHEQQQRTADSQRRAHEAAVKKEKEKSNATEQAKQLACEQNRLAAEQARLAAVTAEEVERKLAAARGLRQEEERLAALRTRERADEERLLQARIRAAEAEQAAQEALHRREEAERNETQRQRDLARAEVEARRKAEETKRLESERNLREIAARVESERLERLAALEKEAKEKERQRLAELEASEKRRREWTTRPGQDPFETSIEYAGRLASYGVVEVARFRFNKALFDIERGRFILPTSEIKWHSQFPTNFIPPIGFALEADRDQALVAYDNGSERSLLAVLEASGSSFRPAKFSIIVSGNSLPLINLSEELVVSTLNEILTSMIVVNPGRITLEKTVPAERDLCIDNSFYLCKHVIPRRWQQSISEMQTSCRRPDSAAFFNYQEAIQFSEDLNRMAEKWEVSLPDGFTFGLPTSDQWEYACRAGSCGLNGFLNPGIELPVTEIYWDQEGEISPPVCQPKCNAWGFHGMQGFAHEWCHSPRGYLDLRGYINRPGIVSDQTDLQDRRLVAGGLVKHNGVLENKRPSSISGVYPTATAAVRLALVRNRM